MPFMVDLHIHTTAGSADSSLRPPVVRDRALALGIHGVNLTEHFRVWELQEAEALTEGTGLLAFRGMEWSTDLGHVLVLGVDRYVPELRRAEDLRRYVLACDGFMIAAHPFRHAFDPVARVWKAHKGPDLSVETACQHPVFELVDAVEVLNGACTDRENALAAAVAARLGLPGVGGSDAHYADDVGRAVTVFDRVLQHERELVAALRAGAFRAAPGPAASHYIHGEPETSEGR